MGNPVSGVGGGIGGGITTLPPVAAGGARLPLGVPAGAVRIGNVIYTAAQVMQAIEAANERSQVNDALSRFRLSPTDARDLLAARAYVWSRNMLPMTQVGAAVPFSGAVNEAVAMAVMRHELMNPGAAGAVSRGDPAATRAMAGVIEGVIVSESRARPAGVAVELQTTSATARAALTLLRGDGMQVHHLVPVEVYGNYAKFTALAAQAGWKPDDPRNLIALPATNATQAKLAALGVNLPMHNGSHKDYNVSAEKLFLFEARKLGPNVTSINARAVLEKVAADFRHQIMTGQWHPRVH